MEKELLEGYSISPLQQLSWSRSNGNPRLSAACRIRVAGRLDDKWFARTVHECVRRHEIFRTRFDRLPEMTLPVQVVMDELDPAVEILDLRDLSRPDSERALEAIRRDMAERGPGLLQFQLVHRSDQEHALLIAASPLVADALTLRNLAFEICQALESSVVPADSVMQYPDVAAWLNEFLSSPEAAAGREFWRQRIGVYSSDEPTSDSEVARHTISAEIPQDVMVRLESLAGSQDRLKGLLLTCWLAVLQRFGLQSGSPMAVLFDGRAYSELSTAMGPIARFAPVSAHVEDESVFSSLVTAVSAELNDCEKWLECFDPALWNEASGDYERRRAKAFEYLDIGGSRKSTHSFEIQDISVAGESFALLARCIHRGTTMQLQLEWDPSLWESELIENLKRAFVTLISNADPEAAQTVATLLLIDGLEREHILENFNRTAVDFGSGSLLHQLFSRQAARTPELIAVQSDEETLTYRQLEARSNQLAHYLRKQGVGPDTLVGICMDRSAAMVEALLGVLKAGGAYVPLDPEYPRERLAYMIEDSRAVVLLTQSYLASLDSATRQICLDDVRHDLIKEDATAPSVSVWPENPAYVIYTSGSTGKPKGAMITHRAICNHMLWMQSAFPLNQADSVLQKTAFSFDASVWEFYAPLFVGARLVMARPGGHQDADYLAAAVARHGITTLQLVPSVLRALLEVLDPEKCSSLRRLFCGGEALPVELVNRFRSKFPGVELCNLYGPTETTIDSTFWTCPPEGVVGSVPIGKPVANMEAYVLDSELQPVPCGVAGELYIGGEGLGRGYYRRPDLTAERFVPHAFSGRAGSRLYRTGDLARFRNDGTIDYLGRADHQVKIRGFRIEPGEIQARLAEHPDVNEALVLALQDRPGHQGQTRLVAYITADAAAVSADQLRRHLAVHLPDYMIPSAFVFLDAFPLTPNGKIDRNALPAPDLERSRLGSTFRSPRSASEELLAGLFAQLLGLDRVGIDDSFFDLGGHSLLATQLVSRIRSAFRIDLPLRAIFESPSVAALAQRIGISDGSESSIQTLPIPLADRTQPLALSFAQQRLWFLDQLMPGSPLYHIPAAIAMKGTLDVAALERALGQLLVRHEALRTRFVTSGTNPVQVITPPSPVRLHVHDLSSASDPQAHLDQLMADAALLPFDLAQGPLARFSLVRMSAEHHVLLLTLHHIVSDGWSLNVLVEDLLDFYQATPSRPEPPIQYADFAVWQRQWLASHGQDQLAYWTNHLAGDLPVLQLPADHPRPTRLSAHAEYIERQLPVALSQGLVQLSRSHQVTLFMTLLAAWKLLLSRYSSQSDIVVGTPIANRTRPELESLIGFFVNTLVLRTDLSGDPTFVELLDRIREVCLGAYAHQDLPFEQLVEVLQPDRDSSHNPLFQVVFTVREESPIPPALPGLNLSVLEPPPGVAKFDLMLDFAPSGDSLQAVIEYSPELFERGTIERMLDHLFTLLDAIAADPSRRLSELSMLSAAERHQLLVEFNRTTADYPDQPVHRLFESRVENNPNGIAVIREGVSIPYAELNRRANRLAHDLQSMGVGPEVLVAICLDHSVNMLVAILATVKAGGAYLPLDLSYPPDRLAFMLEDSQAAVLVCNSSTALTLPAHFGRTVNLDTDAARIAARPDTNVYADVDLENAAYVMYTSGSTGRPKGSVIRHRGIVRLVCNTNYVRLDAADRMAQVSNMSFDAATFEIWGALTSGGCLVMIGREVSLTPRLLAASLREHRVTTMFLTVALFNQIAAEAPDAFNGMTNLLVGGQAVDAKWARTVLENGGPRRLINGYGPTENTTFSTWHLIDKASAAGTSVPIGRPLANSQAYLLDANLEPVPSGVIGDLYVGGDGLARNYLRRPDLTAERFIPNPFASHPGDRLYKTGDLARLLPDGSVDFCGRADGQVKIRGFRVELAEIEAVLNTHPLIRVAVVVAREPHPGDIRIAAYAVLESHGTLTSNEAREFLRRSLPEFMLPSAFAFLEALPLNANGKPDYQALPECNWQAANARYSEPRNAVERVLAGIWAELLSVATLGIHDNFFELGGHSLLATQLVSRIRETFQLELALKVIFEAPTVAALAEAMRVTHGADTLEQIAEIIQQVAELSEDEVAHLTEREGALR